MNFFEEEQLMKLMKEVLLPLEYLHSNGLTHGDIRGPNILIDANDDYRLFDVHCILPNMS